MLSGQDTPQTDFSKSEAAFRPASEPAHPTLRRTSTSPGGCQDPSFAWPDCHGGAQELECRDNEGNAWPLELGADGVYTWASNTLARADQVREVLGYAPDAPSLLDTLEGDLLAAVEHAKRNGPTYCPGLQLW